MIYSWLSDERFKIWVRKGKDSHKATCIVCNTTLIDTSQMGVTCLYHMQKEQNKERVNDYSPMSSLYFTKERQSNAVGLIP